MERIVVITFVHSTCSAQDKSQEYLIFFPTLCFVIILIKLIDIIIDLDLFIFFFLKSRLISYSQNQSAESTQNAKPLAYMPYVLDCAGQSRILILCPGIPEIPKIKSTDFLRPIEREGFVINSCLNDKCCICCRVPIISGIPVVIDRH